MKKCLFGLLYHSKKVIILSNPWKKRLKKFLPETVSMQVTFLSWKLGLSFNIKDETKLEHRYNAFYHEKYPEDDCPMDYIGETKRRIVETIKGHKDVETFQCFYRNIEYNLETDI